MAVFDAGTIEAILRLRDEFTGVAKRVATQAQTLGTRFTDVGRRARAVGAGLTTGVTLPLAAAVKASTTLNALMAEIATLIPGNTERVKALKGSVQDLAIATGQGTADMAGGLYQVISAVGDTQDTVKILEINARAATAGLSTTSEAIQLTSAVTKGYGDTSSAAFQQASDLAFQTVKLGQTTFPELASSIGRVAPLTAQLRISQEELFGVMATGTGVVGTASEVSTGLRGVLQSLSAPTGAMTALLASMGLESGKALIEQQGLQGAIDTVVGAAERAGAPLQDYVSSMEGQTLALALAGPQADTFTEKLAAMQTATGATDQAFAEITGGINAAGFQFKQLWREVTVAAQRFGDELIPQLLKLKPTLTDMVEGLKATVQWFADLPAPVQKTILVAVGLVAALGPLLLVVGQMSMGVGALLPLFGSLTTAFGFVFGSLASGFAMLMTPSVAFAAVMGKVGLLLATLKAVLLTVVGVFASLLTPVGALVAVVGLVVAAFAALLVGTEQGRAVLAATGRLIKEGVVFAFNLLRDALEGAWEWTKTFSAGLIDMIPQVVLDSLDWMAKTIGGLADDIGRTNDLSQLTRDLEGLAEGGRLTGEALETVARQAIALRDQGKPLTDELTDVVARFEEMQREAAHLKSMLDALSQVTSLDYLSTVTLQLAESGQASSEVMKVIAQRAQELQPEGVALSEVLQNVVNAYGEAATAGKGFGDNTGNAGPPVQALAEDVQALINTWTGASLESKALVAAFEALSDEQLGNKRLMAQVLSAYESMREVLGPFHAELEQLWQTHERLTTPLESNADLTDRLMQAQIAATQAQAALNERLDAHRRALLNLPTDQAITAFEALRMTWDELSESERADATEAYSAALKQAAESGIRLTAEEAALVGQDSGMNWVDGFFGTLSRAFEGGGGFMGGIKSLFSKGLGQIFSSLGGGEGGGFTDAAGKLFSGGGVLGKIGSVGTKIGSGIGKFMSVGLNAVPIVGPFLAAFGGPLLKGVGKLFKKMFGGPSEAELAGRETAGAFRDGVIATLNDDQLAEAANAALGAWRGNERGSQFLIGVRDAYRSVGRSAAEAEAMVNRLWEAEARGPEAVAAVQREMQVVLDQAADLRAQFEQIAELQTFDSATDQLQQLTSAAEFFGVEADEMGERLGNAFKAVEQAATAEDIAQHFHTLLASGVDLGTALDLAKDKVQGVITASVQMGTEIPASMQPIAAQLIAQGQLLDASGKKITDINQLEFGTSMTEGLQILVLSMNQLIETMGGEIPDAAKKFAQGVGDGARDAEQTLRDTILAQVENIGLAVHDLSVEELAQMATAFETTALAAGLSLEGALGEKLDALTTGLGSMSRDALPELVRSFQQTATDATLALDRIPRTIAIQHHTQFTSSGAAGASPGPPVHAQHGTPFVDFGAGTAAMLHGVERVQTKAQHESEIKAVVREAADLGALRQELADLKRIMERGQDELPFRMSRAIRDAMAETV